MTKALKLADLRPWQMDLEVAGVGKSDGFCIGVGDRIPPDQVLKFATENGVHHVCQRQGADYEKEIRSAKQLIAVPDSFRQVPVACALTPDDLTRSSERSLVILEEHFNGSECKQDVIAAISKMLESKGHVRTVVDDVLLVADEMFTNAVYNAPFVDMKTQANPGINRHETEVTFGAGKKARMFLAQHESRLLIGCEDPYGTLSLPHYLLKIRNTYVNGPADSMNFGAGGAGLGSYIIFNTGSSLFFGVWPASATIVCCVIPLGMSYRKRLELPKHLHWIQR